MTIPSLVFEVAFDSDPLDDTPTWTDITTYVRHRDGVQITRGRASELDAFSPGSARLTLDNRDRRFDPRYTAGPYYGKLLAGKQARIRATWNAVTVDVFTGFVNGWPNEYAKGGTDAWVPLEMTDGLSRLHDLIQPDPVAVTTMTDIGDCELWLRNSDGTTWYDASGNGRNATRVNAPEYSTASVSASLSPGLTSVSVTGGRWTLPSFQAAPLAEATLSFWYSSTAKAEDAASRQVVVPIIGGSTTPSPGVVVYLLDAINSSLVGVVHAETSAPNSAVADDYDDPWNDGQPHHVVVLFQVGISIYVDGVLEIQAAGPANDVTIDTLDLTTWDDTAGLVLFSPPQTHTTVQDVTAWSQMLTAGEIATLYERGTGRISESTAARFTRLLDNVDWPTAWRNITTSAAATCLDYTPAFESTLDALNEVAATEQGRCFIDKSGRVALQGRYFYLTETRGTTAQATFSDDGADIAYEAIGTDFDERDVRNDITVTATGDVTGSAEDAASIAAYTRRYRGITTLLPDGDAARGMALGLLVHSKDATTRTRGPIVARADNRKNSTAEVASLLGLEIGDRIRHEQTPMRIGSQAVLQLLVEGISWDIDMNEWIVSIDASPVPGAGAAATSFLVIGDATYGVVGTGLVGY